MKIFSSILIFLFSILLQTNHAFAQQKIVTASQVNGTWSFKDKSNGHAAKRFGEFKILALGNQKLQIEFEGAYEYWIKNNEWNANTGFGRGIAFIEGISAKFKPDDAEAECNITMQFKENSLRVTQIGFCGFGNNVSAAGTYHKTNKNKPVFNDNF